MIDAEGFRSNVGIILCNAKGELFWARRVGQNSWQFPQGGIQAGESPEQAMYRELNEEIGLGSQDVSIIGCSRGWLRYRLPRRLVRQDSTPVCVGQKQKWFLLSLQTSEDRVRFNCTEHPEFDGWQWVSYWYPLRQVVSFKRDVYRRALHELAPLVLPMQRAQEEGKAAGSRKTRWREQRPSSGLQG